MAFEETSKAQKMLEDVNTYLLGKVDE